MIATDSSTRSYSRSANSQLPPLLDSLGDEAQKWVIKQIEDHGLTVVVLSLAPPLLICAGIIWYWGKRVGIKGATLDNRKKQAELTTGLAAHRKRFESAKESLNIAMGSTRAAIDDMKTGRKSPEQLRMHRDEMCRMYEHDYFPALCDYLDQIWAVETAASAASRMESELLPALKFMCRFLDAINKPMLDHIPGIRFQLRKETRDGLLDKVKKCVPLFDRELRNALEEIEKRTDAYIRVE